MTSNQQRTHGEFLLPCRPLTGVGKLSKLWLLFLGFSRKKWWWPRGTNRVWRTSEPCSYRAGLRICIIKSCTKRMQQANWFYLLIPSDSTRWLADTAPDLLCNLPESLTNTVQIEPCFRICNILLKTLSRFIVITSFRCFINYFHCSFFFLIFTKTLSRKNTIKKRKHFFPPCLENFT